MSSVKTVLIEMLSTFDAKSRLSAKQLKEQLHTCWPVPNSRVALDQVRKELRDEMKQSLEVVSPNTYSLVHVHELCVCCSENLVCYTQSCHGKFSLGSTQFADKTSCLLYLYTVELEWL